MTTSLVPSLATFAPESDALREEVRDFLAQQRSVGGFVPRVDSWISGWDEEFSRELGRRGWLGMVIPRKYGGQGRSHLDRYVVTEELLAAGAPVAAHWVADRQVGPALMRYGTDYQRHRYLPGISRGETYFAIGMSEPESGSDLASVQTRAAKVDGGWELSGTKVWSSGAHHAAAFFVLARSEPLDPAHRHAGLSQFIVELDSPGIDIRPIKLLTGHHHFNEVLLEKVFVPDELVLGNPGDGWRQVTSELAVERSGPERILSSYPLLACFVGELENQRRRRCGRRTPDRCPGGADVHASPSVVVDRGRALGRQFGRRSRRPGQGPWYAVRGGAGRARRRPREHLAGSRVC